MITEMIVYCLAEMLLLFVGTLLWFFIHSSEKQRKVVITNLSQVFTSCFKQTPPPPIVDPMMLVRLGAFVAFAVALNGNEDLVKSWWDEVLVFLWGDHRRLWTSCCLYCRPTRPSVQPLRHL